MPVLKLQREMDLTPKTSLKISGNGKVVIEISASIDVPEPLLAQQIVDSVNYVAEKAKKKLQKKVTEGETAGWSDKDLEKKYPILSGKIREEGQSCHQRHHQRSI